MSDKGDALLTVLHHYGVSATASRATQMQSCPLHPDRTPSMSVNLTRGLWNCLSCGKGGDHYTLVELMESVGFVEAKALAADLGAAVEQEEREETTGSAYGGRRTVTRKDNKSASSGGYKPSWRR